MESLFVIYYYYSSFNLEFNKKIRCRNTGFAIYTIYFFINFVDISKLFMVTI